jgi:hypothetical protein
MAKKKFTELPAATTPLDGTEIIAIVQDGVSKQTTVSDVGAGGAGTVTSVSGLSPLFTVSNPTTTPTFAQINQAANVVFAGPTNGAAAAPTFRALVTADLPSGTIQNLQSVLDTGSTAVLGAALTITGAFDVVFGNGGSKLNSFSVVTSSGFSLQHSDASESSYIIGNGVNLDLAWGDGTDSGRLLMDTSGNVFSGTKAFTFTPTATVSGFNFGSFAGDPSALNNADAWYNSTSNLLKARINGATVSLLTSATGISNVLTSAQIIVGNGSNVATAVAMSGQATISNTGAVTLDNAAVIAKVLTGYTSGAGTVAATDTILEAIQKLNGNDATKWSLASGGALTANNTLSGAFSVTFNLSSTTSPFNVTGGYTVPAGVAVSSYLATIGGTIVGKGTSNDLIAGLRVSTALNNSTGAAVSHVTLRVDGVHGGSITPANSISIQAIAGHSTSIAEVFRGVSSSGATRHQMFGDGRQVWTTTTTGSDFGGTMSTNAANGTGHLLHSFQLSMSATTGHTHFGQKFTGGGSTNATNATYNSIWDFRSHVVGHTGYTTVGYRYDPQFSGAQAGTEVNYFIVAVSGLSGFQAASNTPTAIVHVGAVTTARASFRIDPGSTTTAPASPNSGDMWHEGTGNRLMFRAGGTSVQVLAASAVTTEAVVSDTTLTISYNNVTYKILARA